MIRSMKRAAGIVVYVTLAAWLAAGCQGTTAAPATSVGPTPSATASPLPTRAVYPTRFPTASLVPLPQLTPATAAPAVPTPTLPAQLQITMEPSPLPQQTTALLTPAQTRAQSLQANPSPAPEETKAPSSPTTQARAATGTRAVAATPAPATAAPPDPAAAASGKAAGVRAGAEKGTAGHIAFTRGRGNDSDVALLDVAGGKVTVLAENGRQPDLRYDGSQVAFRGAGNGREGLFTIRVDGRGLTQVGSRTDDQYPSWALGRDIGLAYFTTGFDPPLICLQFDPDGRQGDTILRKAWIPNEKGDPKPVTGGFPVWVAPGRIAFTGCDSWVQGSDCGIWSLDAAEWRDFQPYRIAEDTQARPNDVFGQTLLYSSPLAGNWDIYAIRWTPPARKVDPKAVPVQLTKDLSRDTGATFSPDGTHIAFMSDRGGAWGIWIMNADGSRPRELTPVPQGFGPHPDEERLSWGP
jgi:hypothetical protein